MIDRLKPVIFAATLSLAAALTGCDEKARTTHHFDGESSIEIALTSKRALPIYTVDILLRSRHVPETPFETTDTTPPMPFRLGRLAAHLSPEGYKLWLRDSDQNIIVNSTVGEPGEFTRLTFVGDRKMLIIYVNGGETVRTSRPVALGGPIIAGSGYRQRFWDGDIVYFDVYNRMKALGEFAPDADRFDEDGRVGSLPTDL